MIEPVRKCLQDDRFAIQAEVELISVSAGFARAKMPLRPAHMNGLGTVQGGAVFTLADYAFAAAANSHGTVAVALNASITFLKAVRTGTLWAEAKELSKTVKIGSYSVEVRDDAGDLVAHFQGTAYRKADKVPS